MESQGPKKFVIVAREKPIGEYSMLAKFSKEFREEAIKLSDDLNSIKKAAESLGVKYSTLADWRSKRNKQKKME